MQMAYWNLKVLVFEKRGKWSTLSKEEKLTTNLAHIWCRQWDFNLGHIDGKQVLSSP